MVIYVGGRNLDVLAKVDHFVKEEICSLAERRCSQSDVYEYAIDHYGENVIEWLNNHEKKPVSAYPEWFKEEGSEVVEKYDPPGKYTDSYSFEKRIANEQYERQRDLRDDLIHSLTRPREQRFITALIIRHRDELKEDARNGFPEKADDGDDGGDDDGGDE